MAIATPARARAREPSTSRPSSTADTDRNFGVAISRAFDVLRCYTARQPVLGVSDIARMTELPKATVSRLTYTLESLGYLYRLSPTGKYRLAWGVLSLGYPLLTSMPIRQLARPEMHALALALRANVNLGTFDRLRVVYLESVRFDETSVARPDIGVSHPVLDSSIGKVLLASVSGAQSESLQNRLCVVDAKAWAAAKPVVARARRELLDKHYCAFESCIHPGFLTVAAPMKVPMHEEPLAFNCAMPLSQIKRGQIERDIGPRLVAMVRTIETKIGFA